MGARTCPRAHPLPMPVDIALARAPSGSAGWEVKRPLPLRAPGLLDASTTCPDRSLVPGARPLGQVCDLNPRYMGLCIRKVGAPP